MCGTCGCTQPDSAVTVTLPGEAVGHEHHHHHHHHHGEESRKILIEEDILAKNNHAASHNRKHFEEKSLFVLNLVSSPGSGKTTLLERTLTDVKDRIDFSVIEGDQQTMQDAERIEATGVPVVQVNTGAGCHLDADMVHRAVHKLEIKEKGVLFIENVGNLVCPALFDLGEAHKVVVISVTEGEDKPYKYPNMFAAADVCIINKIDLLPYVDFDMEACRNHALRVNPHLEFFDVSAKTGEGMQAWYDWLLDKSRKTRNGIYDQ